MEIKKDHINFAVGPVMISEEISALGADLVPYFRTPEFSALMLENERILKELMDAPEGSRAVFLTGSGTASMDAAIRNLFTAEDRLLIVKGGGFGHRFCEIAEVYGIPHDEVIPETGHTIRAEHLEPFAGKKYTAFVVNMDETSTGVLYDMDLISRFCKENGMMLVVDVISAFLTDEFSMKDLGADVMFTGSQKALAVPPGVSMMVLSPRAQERVWANPSACFYLDLKAALKNQERGQTPWTPAVGILIQINARLNQIARDGLATERARIREVADYFRRRIKDYPFTVFSDSLSYCVTPLSPNNPEVSAHHLFEVLKDEYGIIVCPNGGELADKVFRVGHIGALTTADYDRLFDALDDLMRRGILKA